MKNSGVMGWSGGGMPTTICAHEIPERLLFNFTFAGYTNWAEMPNAGSYLAGGRDDVENAGNMFALSTVEDFSNSLKPMQERLNTNPEEAYAAIINQLDHTDKAIAAGTSFKEIFISLPIGGL